MPRAKTSIGRGEWDNMRKETEGAEENNDCSVKAVAIVCRVSYRQALWALTGCGRKPGKGATSDQMRRAITMLGKNVRAKKPEDLIRQYPKPHCDVLKGITTHHPERFPKVYGKQKWPLLMLTATHAVGFRDGRVHDWSVGRALRVIELYEIY